ncbi:MAG TPA: DMT family transporter [Caldilineae bacterium]|nr:DMT family transporter [Caldilineae bacterium]
MVTPAHADSRRGLLYVAIAVIFLSTTPVFIRWAGSISSYEIAFWRLLVAALMLRLAMWIKGERWTVPRPEWRMFAVFGLITALHFLFYIASLSFTTIAHSLAIVYTAPIFVTLFSAIFLHERIARRKWLGIVLAVVGIGVLAGFQPQFTRSMLFGDALALGSAITFGLYSVAGRSQRNSHSLFTYAMTIYGAAALWALAPAALFFTPAGYTPLAILSVIALGVLPLGIGHTLYNAALRYTHATYVNVIATQEVTGGILLGVILLGETPAPNEIAGVVITLLGILTVIL